MKKTLASTAMDLQLQVREVQRIARCSPVFETMVTMIFAGVLSMAVRVASVKRSHWTCCRSRLSQQHGPTRRNNEPQASTRAR